MTWPFIVIVGTQILFTTSDLIARFYMVKEMIQDIIKEYKDSYEGSKLVSVKV